MGVESLAKPVHPNQQKLIDCAAEFLTEVKNLTPGKELEARLNAVYGPGNRFYDQFVSLIKEGLANDEGWVATDEVEVGRPHYRRSKVSFPTRETHYFSITTVYMENEEEFAGQYHQHPYGEINCVIQLTPGAELEGMSGWQGTGWTSPGPGTHHYPRVRKGALVALFFLPAGRISYTATPDMQQPLSI